MRKTKRKKLVKKWKNTILFFTVFNISVITWFGGLVRATEAHAESQYPFLKTDIPSKVVAKPVVVEPVEEEECEWSRACVEAYIDVVAKGDRAFADWAKFTANWEGGYRNQGQSNMSDVHTNGEVGSFGQFQFGRGTYDDHCEESSNWKTDWQSQTRCAKRIWDKGMAHRTWFNTTNKYLSEKGLSKLASN